MTHRDAVQFLTDIRSPHAYHWAEWLRCSGVGAGDKPLPPENVRWLRTLSTKSFAAAIAAIAYYPELAP